MSKETAVVRTPLGDYEGRVRDGVAAFRGIPYAEPPFGPWRFRAPVPVGPHDGVRPCFEFGATAPKPPYPSPVDQLLIEPVIPGDDCLNLNVWTPLSAVTEADAGRAGGLPVLVWVHGGAFVHGSSAVPVYDGAAFARDGVVCVTINYRLGVEGFLLLDGVPANRGLLDQLAALAWVRDTIAAFGGDPGRVTVAGESAGAMSISTLLAMPRAQGSFQQAITQSGAAAHVLTEAVSRRVTAGLAELLGIEPTASGFAAVDRDQLLAGQDRFAAAVTASRDVVTWGELTRNAMPFEPTIDGDVLPGTPIRLLQAGAGAGVRLLTGTNRDEMTLFLAPTGILEHADDAVLAGLAQFYGLPAEGVATYRASRPDATAGQLLVDVVSDWFFRIPAIRVAEARAQAGAQPTYLYEFGWRTPQWDGRLGSTHALEVPFVFDTLAEPDAEPLVGPNPPQKLADRMHAAWVAFAATGEPGWPAYGDARNVMTFVTDGDVVADPRGRARAAWDGRR